MSTHALILLCFVLACGPKEAVSVKCYWCTGVGEDRSCERNPRAVTSGPGQVDCQTRYCTATKVINAATGVVSSFARNCDHISHGNVCVEDGRLVTCYLTCTTHLCNHGDPDPSHLPVGDHAREYLGLPAVEDDVMTPEEGDSFSFPGQRNFRPETFTESKFSGPIYGGPSVSQGGSDLVTEVRPAIEDATSAREAMYIPGQVYEALGDKSRGQLSIGSPGHRFETLPGRFQADIYWEEEKGKLWRSEQQEIGQNEVNRAWKENRHFKRDKNDDSNYYIEGRGNSEDSKNFIGDKNYYIQGRSRLDNKNNIIGGEKRRKNEVRRTWARNQVGVYGTQASLVDFDPGGRKLRVDRYNPWRSPQHLQPKTIWTKRLTTTGFPEFQFDSARGLRTSGSGGTWRGDGTFGTGFAWRPNFQTTPPTIAAQEEGYFYNRMIIGNVPPALNVGSASEFGNGRTPRRGQYRQVRTNINRPTVSGASKYFERNKPYEGGRDVGNHMRVWRGDYVSPQRKTSTEIASIQNNKSSQMAFLENSEARRNSLSHEETTHTELARDSMLWSKDFPAQRHLVVPAKVSTSNSHNPRYSSSKTSMQSTNEGEPAGQNLRSPTTKWFRPNRKHLPKQRERFLNQQQTPKYNRVKHYTDSSSIVKHYGPTGERSSYTDRKHTRYNVEDLDEYNEDREMNGYQSLNMGWSTLAEGARRRGRFSAKNDQLEERKNDKRIGDYKSRAESRGLGRYNSLSRNNRRRILPEDKRDKSKSQPFEAIVDSPRSKHVFEKTTDIDFYDFKNEPDEPDKVVSVPGFSHKYGLDTGLLTDDVSPLKSSSGKRKTQRGKSSARIAKDSFLAAIGVQDQGFVAKNIESTPENVFSQKKNRFSTSNDNYPKTKSSLKKSHLFQNPARFRTASNLKGVTVYSDDRSSPLLESRENIMDTYMGMTNLGRDVSSRKDQHVNRKEFGTRADLSGYGSDRRQGSRTLGKMLDTSLSKPNGRTGRSFWSGRSPKTRGTSIFSPTRKPLMRFYRPKNVRQPDQRTKRKFGENRQQSNNNAVFGVQKSDEIKEIKDNQLSNVYRSYRPNGIREQLRENGAEQIHTEIVGRQNKPEISSTVFKEPDLRRRGGEGSRFPIPTIYISKLAGQKLFRQSENDTAPEKEVAENSNLAKKKTHNLLRRKSTLTKLMREVDEDTNKPKAGTNDQSDADGQGRSGSVRRRKSRWLARRTRHFDPKTASKVGWSLMADKLTNAVVMFVVCAVRVVMVTFVTGDWE